MLVTDALGGGGGSALAIRSASTCKNKPFSCEIPQVLRVTDVWTLGAHKRGELFAVPIKQERRFNVNVCFTQS
jgi:hypothetical protein